MKAVSVPEWMPVIVGVSQVNNRPSDPLAGLMSAGLMETSRRAAEPDVGDNWLADLTSLAVVDLMSFCKINSIAPGLAAQISGRPTLCGQSAARDGIISGRSLTFDLAIRATY